jgi:hypothetical protein
MSHKIQILDHHHHNLFMTQLVKELIQGKSEKEISCIEKE